MNDLIELMSIIGTLENQKRKDIDQGHTTFTVFGSRRVSCNAIF